MSYGTGRRARSWKDNNRSGNYLDDRNLDYDAEPLRSDGLCLEDDNLDTPDLTGMAQWASSADLDAERPDRPAALWPGVPADRDAERDRAGDLPGLGFALSERLDLLKARIDTLLREAAKRRKLHRFVQKAVKGELRELDHLLRDVKVWSLGVSPSVDGRRTNLEREAISLKKTAWEERLRHWRDLVWLEKELQEALERYRLATTAQGLTESAEQEGKR